MTECDRSKSFVFIFTHRTNPDPFLAAELLKETFGKEEQHRVHILSLWDPWHRALAPLIDMQAHEMLSGAALLSPIPFRAESREPDSNRYYRLLIGVVEAGTIAGSDLIAIVDVQKRMEALIKGGEPETRHVFIVLDVRSEKEIAAMENFFPSKQNRRLVRFTNDVAPMMAQASVRTSMTETTLNLREQSGSFDIIFKPDKRTQFSTRSQLSTLVKSLLSELPVAFRPAESMTTDNSDNKNA